LITLTQGQEKDYPEASFRRRERLSTGEQSVIKPDPVSGLGAFTVILLVDSGKHCMRLERVMAKYAPQHGQQEKDKEKNRSGKNKENWL
jgi:hypothetical protein